MTSTNFASVRSKLCHFGAEWKKNPVGSNPVIRPNFPSSKNPICPAIWAPKLEPIKVNIRIINFMITIQVLQEISNFFSHEFSIQNWGLNTTEKRTNLSIARKTHLSHYRVTPLIRNSFIQFPLNMPRKLLTQPKHFYRVNRAETETFFSDFPGLVFFFSNDHLKVEFNRAEPSRAELSLFEIFRV